MLGLRRRKYSVPSEEKRELAQVQQRLDSIEPRVDQLELQLKLIRREK